jgi:hypothetical protein
MSFVDQEKKEAALAGNLYFFITAGSTTKLPSTLGVRLI